MPVRIKQKTLLSQPVFGFFVVLMALILTDISTEKYQSFILTLGLYVELLSLLALSVYLIAGRHGDSGYGVKYSFNSEGILVNKHLVYPWTEVKSVSFVRLTERYALKQFSTARSMGEYRELGNVPARDGGLVPIYRTYSHGNLEVYSEIGSRPSVVIKCAPSFFSAKRLLRKMKKYSTGLNPDINFHIRQN